MAKVTDRCFEATGHSAFICDFSPPRTGDPQSFTQPNLDADFISVAYNPGRAVRVNSAMLAAAIKGETGKDVLFTLATRDMNKLALESLLLGGQMIQTIHAVFQADVKCVFQQGSVLSRQVVAPHPSGENKWQSGPGVPLFSQVVLIGVFPQSTAAAQGLVAGEQKSRRGIVQADKRFGLNIMLKRQDYAQKIPGGAGLRRHSYGDTVQLGDGFFGEQKAAARPVGDRQAEARHRLGDAFHPESIGYWHWSGIDLADFD